MKQRTLLSWLILFLIFSVGFLFYTLNGFYLKNKNYENEKKTIITEIKKPYLKLQPRNGEQKIIIYIEKNNIKDVFPGQKIKILTDVKDEQTGENLTYSAVIKYISKVSEPLPGFDDYETKNLFFCRKISAELENNDYFKRGLPYVLIIRTIKFEE